MDPRDLKTSSIYLNNLLAARGIIRGLPIDFAKPTKDSENPPRILNLVHSLITRQDREDEQRENLALMIRTMRNAETKQNSTIELLKSKVADLERRNSQLEAQTRSFNSTIRTAESSAKTLRDETIRLKTLLAQVRSQSANDIRKRDMQLQRMKERLLDTRRGSRPTPSTIVVKGPQTGSNLGRSYDELGESTTSSSKELSDETAEFLTTLSQTLADENDNFLALFRYCLSTLKAVQGLPDYDHIPQNEEEEEDTMNPVVATPANFDALNQELEVVLGSLQDMLHQPSYVPVEELAEKEEEIIQLKNRNDILYAEWKKAIDLVDGWNAALVETVDNSRDELSPPPNTVPASRRKSKGRVEDIRAREVSEAAEAQVLRDHQSVIKRAERRRTAGAAELEAEAELAPEAGPEEYEEVEQHGDEEYEEQESDLILEPRREDTPLPETLEEEATEPSAELEEPSAELKEPVPDPEEEAPKPEEEAPELEEDPAPELEKVLEKEPTHEDSSDAEEAESLLPPTPPDDRVIYEEEVIHVRTKPPASSPLPRSRPRTRQQTILGPDIVGMKSEPEEYATSKKRRRSSRVSRLKSSVIVDSPAPPVKKARQRASQKPRADVAADAESNAR